MVWTNKISVEIDTGHRLSKGYPYKCKNIHGHRFLIEVFISGNKLDKYDMLVDFNIIKEYLKTYIEEKFDHKLILYEKDELKQYLDKENTIYLNGNPTCEFLSKYISDLLYDKINTIDYTLKSVRVSESSKQYSEYSINE